MSLTRLFFPQDTSALLLELSQAITTPQLVMRKFVLSLKRILLLVELYITSSLATSFPMVL